MTQIDNIYKMILISWQNGLRSGKLCLILGSVSDSTQDMGMKTHIIQWVVLYEYYRKGKDSLTISAEYQLSVELQQRRETTKC